MRNTLTVAQRSRERVNWREIAGKINKTWWLPGAGGEVKRGMKGESVRGFRVGRRADCGDSNWTENGSADNPVSETQQEKAQREASKRSGHEYLGYFCFISYLALWPRKFFTPGQEGQIGRCLWKCLGEMFENACKWESKWLFMQQKCITSRSPGPGSLCQGPRTGSLSLLLTSSWVRANKEAQLQSSHLSSLPRKVLEKYLLGPERRTENQNLFSVAETHWPGWLRRRAERNLKLIWPYTGSGCKVD